MDINVILEKIKDELKKVVIELGYADDTFAVVIESPKDKDHGDFATNTALRLAKPARKNPRMVAEEIVTKVDKEALGIEKFEIAGPGFINIYLKKEDLFGLIETVITEGSDYGKGEAKEGKILLEYVSANPTGFLHIGHARGAAYGDALSRIMTKAGYDVTREHYVNDGGNQINNLGKSIEARYHQELGQDYPMPEDGYFGPEIITVAKEIIEEHKGEELDFEFFKEYGVNYLLGKLESHLREYRVEFDTWFRERELHNGKVEESLQIIRDKGYTYKSDDAEWLKTSEFYDDKDRVIVTSDGRYTYIVPDIAYHKNKFDRGYDILLDVLGADHHGYTTRLKSALAMLGFDAEKIEVEMLQMVRVFQNGEEIKMSKRSGKAIGLQDLVEEVGVDPIRYFFAARALSSPMDLDLDLALRQTNENPVYYAQYAHARIQSILNKAEKESVEVNKFTHLNENADELLLLLGSYSKVLEECASKRIPHKLANYIQTLASAFHSYYNQEIIITDNIEETNEKLRFVTAIQIVLRDALSLIGVSAPEKM